VFNVKVPKIDAVNTVGCGDSMIAGFAVGISRGLPIEETIRLASAVSAANAMRMETGFVVMDDVNALLPQIDIKKIR
jgi:tagatose 6-phosphate kinase